MWEKMESLLVSNRRISPSPGGSKFDPVKQIRNPHIKMCHWFKRTARV